MPTFHFTRKSFVISVLCALFIVTAAGWVFTGYLVGMATRIVERELENANAVISINLTSELKRIESAAVAVAGSPLTLPLLQANTPENMEKVNNILDRYHKSLDAAACYLIDQNGLTLASSNRNEKGQFCRAELHVQAIFPAGDQRRHRLLIRLWNGIEEARLLRQCPGQGQGRSDRRGCDHQKGN